eukprot:g10324.t1
MALQKDITLRQEDPANWKTWEWQLGIDEQERRRAQHNEVREELRKQIAEAQEEDWAHPTKIAISSFCGWVWALASFGKYVCRRMSCQSR